MKLPNGVELSTIGTKDFDDNEMNTETGTLAIRYLFDNTDALLIPGGYVNLMLGKADQPLGIRIPQTAILVDPEGNYVLTVDEQGTVSPVHIGLGGSIENDMVVLEGLKAGDRVIIDGVQKVQPGMTAAVTLQEEIK